MTKQTHAADGGWMETFSGGRVDLADPKPSQIHITDIAHALSMINRYTGHTSAPYSVAQHSVLMTHWALDKMDLPLGKLLRILLHDAQEAYIGDVASPLKHMLPAYKEIERNFERAIRERFSLGAQSDATGLMIRTIDLRILATEREQLMPNTGQHDWHLPDWAKPLKITITPWSPADAKAEFIRLFDILWDDRFK